MIRNAEIYLNDLPSVRGKAVLTETSTAVMFSTEAGRYYVTLSANEIKIALSGEVGYTLTLARGRTTGLSLETNGLHSYPLDVETRELFVEKLNDRISARAAYSVENGDEEIEEHEFYLRCVFTNSVAAE